MLCKNWEIMRMENSTFQLQDSERYRQFLDLLAKEPKQDFLVLPHQRIDGDALASALAAMALLRHFGKRPLLLLNEALPRYLETFAKLCLAAEEYVVYRPEGGLKLPEDPGLFVVDSHAAQRLGNRTPLWPEEQQAYIVDHHQGQASRGAWEIIEAERASAAELMAELLFVAAADSGSSFQELFSPDLATAVLMGIYSDTGGLRYGHIGAPLLHLVAQLLDAGAELNLINREIFNSKSLAAQRLAGYALSEFQLLANQRLAFLEVSYARRQSFGANNADFEGLVNQMLATDGVLFAIILRELEDQSWDISLRAMWPYDVASFAQRYGGGGHQQAAGLSLSREAKSRFFSGDDPVSSFAEEAALYCREQERV